MSKTRQRSQESESEKWMKKITAYKSSGISIRAWCSENGVSEGQFYYWQRKLKKITSATANNKTAVVSSAESAHRFAKIDRMVTSTGNMEPRTAIDVGGIKIEVYDDADSDVIETSLRAVLKLC